MIEIGDMSISAEDRVRAYGERLFGVPRSELVLQHLAGDASTRQYFRVFNNEASYIAAVYTEPLDAQAHPYCDVTRLLIRRGIPIPEILAISGEDGIVLQQDLGDLRLQDWLEGAGEEAKRDIYRQAIDIIFDIQAATGAAYEMGSIASKLAFDEAKLLWELRFFYDHYFGRYRSEVLAAGDKELIDAELVEIARELAARPRVLCHRDYHSRNLMLKDGRLFVIDHQDARMGPISYDLASLLYDPYATLRESLISDLYDYFVERLAARQNTSDNAPNRSTLLMVSGAAEAGMRAEARAETGAEAGKGIAAGFRVVDAGDCRFAEEDFRKEFDLMVAQRMLKAVGTYTYQKTICGNDIYLRYIKPAIDAALKAMRQLNRFPALQKAIQAELEAS